MPLWKSLIKPFNMRTLLLVFLLVSSIYKLIESLSKLKLSNNNEIPPKAKRQIIWSIIGIVICSAALLGIDI